MFFFLFYRNFILLYCAIFWCLLHGWRGAVFKQASVNLSKYRIDYLSILFLSKIDFENKGGLSPSLSDQHSFSQRSAFTVSAISKSEKKMKKMKNATNATFQGMKNFSKWSEKEKHNISVIESQCLPQHLNERWLKSPNHSSQSEPIKSIWRIPDHQSTIPNPHYPTPNPQSPVPNSNSIIPQTYPLLLKGGHFDSEFDGWRHSLSSDQYSFSRWLKTFSWSIVAIA